MTSLYYLWYYVKFADYLLNVAAHSPSFSLFLMFESVGNYLVLWSDLFSTIFCPLNDIKKFQICVFQFKSEPI